MIWTTQDGLEISIAKMETQHLKNTVAWIDRRVVELREVERSTYGPAGFTKYADEVADRTSRDIERLLDTKAEMLQELARRDG